MIDLDARAQKMTYLLDQIDARDLALPDFQRSFVWRPDAVRELLVSVFSNYPAGAILLLRDGAKKFTPRAVEEAPELDSHTPAFIALDGQQRLTSLYQASRGRGTHRFYVNLGDLLTDPAAGHEYDIDEAVEVYPVRNARKWVTLEAQAQDLMLPLEEVPRWSAWMFAVIKLRDDRGPNGEELSPLLIRLHDDVIKRFNDYQFAVTTLAAGTPLDAVCSIFETINRTGVKLNVFELLTARAYAEGSNLRERWREAKATHPILHEFQVDPYYLLQVIALRTGRGVKRSDILDLKPSEITNHWDDGARGLAKAYDLVRANCGVYNSNWVPYIACMTVLGAIWSHVDAAFGAGRGAALTHIKRWFWVACFTARFENAVNTRTLDDFRALSTWLQGGSPPDYMTSAVKAPVWREITRRQRSIYRAAMALLLSGKPLDFHSGQALSTQLIANSEIDDHHVFPQAYLSNAKPHGYEWVDSILNRTLIDRKTNILISDKAPSVYLGEIGALLSGEEVERILDSHQLPSHPGGPLFEDRFEDFLQQRSATLDRLLLAATWSG